MEQARAGVEALQKVISRKRGHEHSQVPGLPNLLPPSLFLGRQPRPPSHSSSQATPSPSAQSVPKPLWTLQHLEALSSMAVTCPQAGLFFPFPFSWQPPPRPSALALPLLPLLSGLPAKAPPPAPQHPATNPSAHPAAPPGTARELREGSEANASDCRGAILSPELADTSTTFSRETPPQSHRTMGNLFEC